VEVAGDQAGRFQLAVTTGVLAAIAAAVFLWGACSARLERADLTAPIVFVGLGVVLWAILSPTSGLEGVPLRVLTEITLVWVLFSDAAGVSLRALRADAATYVRLLAVALPLTIALGCLLAWAMFDGLDVWLALFVGAALAPTDASLGQAVITNPAVPVRIRDILNVESGLNDGIATPVVLVALAGAQAANDAQRGIPGHPMLQLLAGVGVGVGIGGLAGVLLRTTRRRGWVAEEFAGPATLALALLAYSAAVTAGSNGFVAAFAAGVAFGNLAGPGEPRQVFYVKQTAALAALLVWTLFGFVAVPLVVHAPVWLLLLYAALSLTAIRMLPVGIVLARTDLNRRAALFIGWFGPRGLASVVFALVAIDELGAGADIAVALVVVTVLASVVLHGLSARPLANRYAATGHRAVTAFDEFG